MRLSTIEKGNPWLKLPQEEKKRIRVTLDGRDVTNDCKTADTAMGYVLLSEPCGHTNCPTAAKHRVNRHHTGRVVIESKRDASR